MARRQASLSTRTPTQHAAELRRDAEASFGDRRAYLLWLADEWEKIADREGRAVGT
jgi:hypothetical protein